jgi:hypothetical protein
MKVDNTIVIDPVTEHDTKISIDYSSKHFAIICDVEPIICSRQQIKIMIEKLSKALEDTEPLA